MTHGSLFTGLGMFDYGAMMAGIETLWQVEINEFCLQLLEKRYPYAKRFKDIKTVRGEDLSPVDIISGGFPCQPHSQAGERKGSKDERNLFPDTLRIFDERRPKWGLLENVYGILNTDNGNFFEHEVISPLESIGYSVQPYIIPASAVGAVHRRDRIWILANSNNNGSSISSSETQNRSNKEEKHIDVSTSVLSSSKKEKQQEQLSETERGDSQTISYPESLGLERSQQTNRSEGKKSNDEFADGCSREWSQNWIEVATFLCGMDASSSGGILKPEYRKQRLEGLGNGIQWEIAYIFFELIKGLNK